MKTIHGFTLQSIFDQAHLSKLGVSFEAFSRAPIAMLEAVGQRDAIDIMRTGFRPLLPIQVQLRRTLDEQWEKEGTPAQVRPRKKSVVRPKQVGALDRVVLAV